MGMVVRSKNDEKMEDTLGNSTMKREASLLLVSFAHNVWWAALLPALCLLFTNSHISTHTSRWELSKGVVP